MAHHNVGLLCNRLDHVGRQLDEFKIFDDEERGNTRLQCDGTGGREVVTGFTLNIVCLDEILNRAQYRIFILGLQINERV
jgi:hypothetical protein